MDLFTTHTHTEVLTTTTRGMDGKLCRHPVRISEVALASIREYGTEPWSDYDEMTLHNFAKENGWNLNLYREDGDIEPEWASFCHVVNKAIEVIFGAISKVNAGQFL